MPPYRKPYPATHQLKGLPGVLDLNPDEEETATAATRQQIADIEVAEARTRFRPHIIVLTKRPDDVHIPGFIQVFAYGHKVMGLSDEFDRMTSAQQVQQAAHIVRLHFRENRGELPVWSTISSYRLQRTFYHAVVMNTDGTVLEGFNRDPEPPPPELHINGKRVPMGLFG